MMAKTDVFDTSADNYDAWFDEHKDIYDLELQALRTLLPNSGDGVEIGVGTGRFAKPLGISIGVEPSSAMRAIAVARGIEAVAGTAEKIPLANESYDYVLMVTTVCFLDDLHKAFSEVHRILRTGGHIVIGFIDKESKLGMKYQQRKDSSRFYKDATFHSVGEILSALQPAGFDDFVFTQAILPGDDDSQAGQTIKRGYGEGSFVVLKARKPV